MGWNPTIYYHSYRIYFLVLEAIQSIIEHGLCPWINLLGERDRVIELTKAFKKYKMQFLACKIKLFQKNNHDR